MCILSVEILLFYDVYPFFLFVIINSLIQGLVAGIQKDVFEFLAKVQEKLVKVIKSVGKIDHGMWRSFHNERKTEPPLGSIDGDLIETCLDLSRDQLKEIVEGLQVIKSFQYSKNVFLLDIFGD